MELILLGSGTGVPLADRGCPSLAFLVNERTVLFDMGPGTMRQLLRAGLDHQNVAGVWLTHFHPDHTGGLVHFLFATRHPGVVRRRNPFHISGPRGTKHFLSSLQQVYGDWLVLPPEVMRFREIQPGDKAIDEGELRISCCPTRHTQESIAYRLEDSDGKKVVYSGDTGYCEEIISLARGADLLILECSFPDGKETEGHLTPTLAGKIAQAAGARRLLLTHFYPECLKTDFESRCRAAYNGELMVGRDLFRIRLSR